MLNLPFGAVVAPVPVGAVDALEPAGSAVALQPAAKPRRERAPSVARAADLLVADGFCVLPNFVRPAEVVALQRRLRQWDHAHLLRPAQTGRGAKRLLNPDTRGDRIVWLNDVDLAGPARRWNHRLDILRTAINRRTFAGLVEWEGHAACYGPGAGFEPHRDRFKDNSERVVSTILYLNDADWADSDGGQLRLWTTETEFVDIVPRGGTFVAFWSDGPLHAVLPATRERWSITGWFRTRGAV